MRPEDKIPENDSASPLDMDFEAPARSALRALIRALETAAEGSRLLDDAIYVWDRDAHERTDEEWLELCRARGGTIPNWTTSLDSALSLVPEGWQWEVRSIPTDEGTNHSAMVNWEPNGRAYGETPALALCIAALRARSAQAEGRRRLRLRREAMRARSPEAMRHD